MTRSTEKQPKERVDNLQIADRDELLALIASLQGQIQEKDAEIASLKGQISPTSEGRGGWLVTTPNGAYNGETAGVMFRNGRAFIPDGPEAAREAQQLKADFGYLVEHVDDWREVPAAPQIKRNFVDSLLRPGGV